MEPLVLAILLYFPAPQIDMSNWSINEVGNICLLYDTNDNGKPDVKTCHRKRIDGYTEGPEPDNVCIYTSSGIRCTVNYTTTGYEYIAFYKPFVYYIDVDEDNVIDFMYIDEAELGILQDFKRYMDIHNSQLCQSWEPECKNNW